MESVQTEARTAESVRSHRGRVRIADGAGDQADRWKQFHEELDALLEA